MGAIKTRVHDGDVFEFIDSYFDNDVKKEVDDYIIYLPQIEKELKEKNEILCEKFLALTYGKRKDWQDIFFLLELIKRNIKDL